MSRRKKKSTRRTRAKATPKIEKSDPVSLLKQVQDLRKSGQTARAREGARRLYRIDPKSHAELFFLLSVEAVQLELENNRFDQALIFIHEAPKFEWLGSETTARLWAITHLFSPNEKQRVEGARRCLKIDDLEEKFTSRAADVLVLAKDPAAKEVTKAIRHLGKQEWDLLDVQLRKITRQSPFSHWRLFLSGFSAWYQGKTGDAEKLFSRLDEDSVPGKKARAILALMGKGNVSEKDYVALGQFLGEPRIIGQLEKAEKAMAADRFHQAESTLSGIPGVPSFKPDFAGMVTHSFLKRIPRAAEADLETLSHRTLDKLLLYEQNLLPSQTLFWATIFVRILGINIPPGAFSELSEIGKKGWNKYQESFANFYPANKRFKAMCLVTLGKNIMGCGDPFGNPLDGFEDCLRKAIKIDPDFEEAYLLLLDLLEREGDTKEVNRLLDEMSKRFPESANIIAKAARNCFNRQAYNKALRYFKKAEKTDPLDSEVRCGIFQSQLAVVFEKAIKGDTKAVKKLLVDLSNYLFPGDPSDTQYVLNSDSYFGTIRDELGKILKLDLPEFSFQPLSKFGDKWIRTSVKETLYFLDKGENYRIPPRMPRKPRKGTFPMGECRDLLKIVLRTSVIRKSQRLADHTLKVARGVIQSASASDIKTLEQIIFAGFVCPNETSATGDAILDMAVDRGRSLAPESLYVKIIDFLKSGGVIDPDSLKKELTERAAEIQSDPSLLIMVNQAKRVIEEIENMSRRIPVPHFDIDDFEDEDDWEDEDDFEDEDLDDASHHPPPRPRRPVFNFDAKDTNPFEVPPQSPPRKPGKRESAMAQEEFDFEY